MQTRHVLLKASSLRSWPRMSWPGTSRPSSLSSSKKFSARSASRGWGSQTRPRLPSTEKQFAPSDLLRHRDRGQTHLASVRAPCWPLTEGGAFSSVNGGKKGRGSRLSGSAFTNQNPHIVPSGHPSTSFRKTYVSLDILHLKWRWSFPENPARVSVLTVHGFSHTPTKVAFPPVSRAGRLLCVRRRGECSTCLFLRRPHMGFYL